jgi:hypothetical protein
MLRKAVDLDVDRRRITVSRAAERRALGTKVREAT